ncbi:flagellar export protein FliJ [bacterium]|nr:flagellar export protein FliJ [bacterium]
MRDLRKWRERSAQQKLAEAQNNRLSASEELDKTINQINDHTKIARDKISQGISAGEALVSANYDQNLRFEADNKLQVVRKCDHAVAICRDDLIEKSREKQVLDSLYDRQFQEFTKEQNSIEQKIMDDAAAQRFYIKGSKEINGN